MFVFSSNGALFQPAGLSFPAWPRYNNRTGTGGDADRNGEGHSGYGCYGLNVGIGNIDDDDDLEIIVTYDNHAHPGVQDRTASPSTPPPGSPTAPAPTWATA